LNNRNILPVVCHKIMAMAQNDIRRINGTLSFFNVDVFPQ